MLASLAPAPYTARLAGAPDQDLGVKREAGVIPALPPQR